MEKLLKIEIICCMYVTHAERAQPCAATAASVGFAPLATCKKQCAHTAHTATKQRRPTASTAATGTTPRRWVPPHASASTQASSATAAAHACQSPSAQPASSALVVHLTRWTARQGRIQVFRRKTWTGNLETAIHIQYLIMFIYIYVYVRPLELSQLLAPSFAT